MKKQLLKLMALCPGKVFIQIDNHKLYNQNAEDYLNESIPEETKYFDEESKALMIEHDAITRIEASPNNMTPTVIVYSHDIELGLKSAIKQIEKSTRDLDKKTKLCQKFQYLQN
jgi:Cu/Ag efflux protein CusF